MYQEWGVNARDLTILFVGEIWKTFGLWIRKALNLQAGFNGHHSRNMQDSNAKSNVEYSGPAQ